MAGRGRGRGKASLSFDVSRLGFGYGENLPKANIQPPALYPTLQIKATPLSLTEVDEYLLALSQEYRGSIRDSPFYLKPNKIKRDIVRYTDRYKQNQSRNDEGKAWEPDWNFVPSELKPTKRRKFNQHKAKVNVSLTSKRPADKEEDIVKKIESLEKVAAKVDKEAAAKQDEEEEYEEEDFDDDNDYNFDYYDDGGDKYGDDDDGDEGPVY